MRYLRYILIVFVCFVVFSARGEGADAVNALLNRIGGKGTAEKFVIRIDEACAEKGEECFVITAEDGKPCITGSTISATTTGINWYLNHVAHVNISWNQLSTNLVDKYLPLPEKEERHVCNADYRYYLNYCTFSYSMSVWTWERWEKEIDWMALHGINMPLQIVGLDVVWKKLLTEDLNYTDEEADKFIAGPCFQAWWGMNNLEGWGGPNPKWWYERQEMLAKKIVRRQRELGMQPVLPGYSGMVPSNISSKGYAANSQGPWCGFVRPYILDPNTDAFADIASKYYKRLNEVMGISDYYSMDPFHEGANTEGIDVEAAYKSIADAMLANNKDARWVIQQWQWYGSQYKVLGQVERGRLIVLDLFSDAHTHFGKYENHDAVYCALSNFGGRTGLFGRLSKVMREYFSEKTAHPNIKGIGATCEAIEQVPVLYDALFELPWHSEAPDAGRWLDEYTCSRYGVDNHEAKQAWRIISNSALNCPTPLQGPHEAVVCARPAWQIKSVSTWGGTDIFYNKEDVVCAAFHLLNAELSGKNYDYDLIEFTRQALTDYAKTLLDGIIDDARYAERRDTFLQLILDIDELLNTNSNFMLGIWTSMARSIADEVDGTTVEDKRWLELDNARTLITTWGKRENSEDGGLRDYSYREWGGMMKDFYYPRWKAFFDSHDNGTPIPDWFASDWAWAHDASLSYGTVTTGSTRDVAERLLNKYFVRQHSSDGREKYVPRKFGHENPPAQSLPHS